MSKLFFKFCHTVFHLDLEHVYWLYNMILCQIYCDLIAFILTVYTKLTIIIHLWYWPYVSNILPYVSIIDCIIRYYRYKKNIIFKVALVFFFVRWWYFKDKYMHEVSTITHVIAGKTLFHAGRLFLLVWNKIIPFGSYTVFIIEKTYTTLHIHSR